MLGATLEVQVVETLNRIRDVWDPNDNWPLYRFDRQAQTFPDVLLRRQTAQGFDVALGIELKGWYVLSKRERAQLPVLRLPRRLHQMGPTRRHTLAPLQRAVRNSPRRRARAVVSPTHRRIPQLVVGTQAQEPNRDPTIRPADNPQPYQQRSNTSDGPAPGADRGGNFGRIARIGIMDTWYKTHSKNR